MGYPRVFILRAIDRARVTNERASERAFFIFFFFLRSSDNLRINFNRLIYNLVSSFIRAFRSREARQPRVPV